VSTVDDRQAGRNEEAEQYYRRSVELRPRVSFVLCGLTVSVEMSAFQHLCCSECYHVLQSRTTTCANTDEIIIIIIVIIIMISQRYL